MTPPWKPWEAVPVAVAAVAATAVAATVLAAVFGGVGGSALLLSATAFQASLAGITVLWVAVKYRGWVPALGLRSRRPASDVAFGAWTGAALFVFTAFVVLPAIVIGVRVVTGHPPDPINQPVLPVEPTLIQVTLGVLAVVIAAPIGEEVFFRGFLFGSLRARFGFGLSALISAGVFALAHYTGGPLLVALMVFVGVALAYLYERRGSLAASMAAHAMFNVIGYTLIVMQRT